MQNIKRLSYLFCLALLVYMPFHIFLSQWLSTFTGGLDLWKIGKDIFLIAATLFTICLVLWQRKGNRVFYGLIIFAFLYGALHLILWFANPGIFKLSAELGIIYNMRLPLCLILGYGTVLLIPKFAFSSVIKIAIYISTLVAFLGIVQYFLPKDLLTHFGYSVARGARAAFYIDDNSNLPLRIISTLREPNALGAYLILPATALFAFLLEKKDKNLRQVLAGALGIHLLAIVLTQSRSALLGVVLACAQILWWRNKVWLLKQVKRHRITLAGLTILVLISGFSARNTPFFQSYVIHSNKGEQRTDLDSNAYHAQFIREGLKGIYHKPLGHGPGTAGLASIQNPKGGLLTENYYIQIGYELGLLGLALFIGLNVWIYYKLHQRKDTFGRIMCAAFWAYVLTNMLLHTWSNEAVATQFWLLAGLIIATTSKK